jgi:hypothetical protein
MKNPITTFNAWVLTKITSYLSTSEGFIVEESTYTASGIKSVIRDTFGYRYEVHVKTLSRLTDYLQDSNETQVVTKKSSTKLFIETIPTSKTGN